MTMSEGKRRWVDAALETLVAFASAALLFYTCLRIRVDPLDQLGRVSGLAALGIRFAVFAIVVIVGLIVMARWRKGAEFDRATRFGCAILAGALGGMLAGGIAIALYKVPYGLNGIAGDSLVLADWANGIKRGEAFSAYYPPGQPYIIAWLSDLFDLPTVYAIKQFEILGVMLIPPMAYLSWRLVLRPIWALGIGVVATLGIVEMYRPYPMLVLAVFIPVSVRFLQTIRRADDRTWLDVVRSGVAFGLAYGAMFLLYSSWFMWSAPGLVVAAAVVFPWRRASLSGAVRIAVTLLVFLLLGYRYLHGFVTAPPLRDDYFAFDVNIDPAYWAMWHGDLPGPATLRTWPPLGELGGIGVFTLLSIVGIGLAVAYARTRTFVISIGAVLVGVWLMRFWYARQMWKTHLVQLWPRTSAEIYYCALLLAGFGVYAVVTRRPEPDVVHQRSKIIGAAVALAIVLATAGSHITQRYLPTEDMGSQSGLAWRAHKTAPLDGNQAMYARVEASSMLAEWYPGFVVDSKDGTAYSSRLGEDDREEWVDLYLPTWAKFNTVVLHPAADAFPTELTVEVWDTIQWHVRAWRRDIHPESPVRIYWGRLDETNLVRIRARKLGRTNDGKRAFRLAEVELYYVWP